MTLPPAAEREILQRVRRREVVDEIRALAIVYVVFFTLLGAAIYGGPKFLQWVS